MHCTNLCTNPEISQANTNDTRFIEILSDLYLTQNQNYCTYKIRTAYLLK